MDLKDPGEGPRGMGPRGGEIRAPRSVEYREETSSPENGELNPGEIPRSVLPL